MVKKLLNSLQEYKKDAIKTVIFVIFEVVMEILIPIFMANIIDEGIMAGSMSQITRIGIYLIVFAILALVFGTLSGKYAATAATGFAQNLRKKMFYNIQEYSFSNIDKFTSASLVTRLTTDVTNVMNAFQMIIRILIKSPLMLILSIGMAISVNPSLALIFAVAIPVLAIGLIFIALLANPIFEKIFKSYDKLNGVVQEDLHGIRVVKSYVREDYENKKFQKVSTSIYNKFVKAERILAFNGPLMQFAMYACMLLISWFGAKLIVGSAMTTGQLTSVLSYSMQILMSLMMLSMVFVMVISSIASAERIIAVLDEESDLKNNDKALTDVADGSVNFNNVSFRYSDENEKNVLMDINLKINSGETIGIIGGTGSSKSTLVQLIPRLYDATTGSIDVGGVDVHDYDLETLRMNVAMVLQTNTLFSGTIKENLRWGNPDATDEQVQKACVLAQADDFIQGLEDKYDTYVEQNGANFSGGQKQRLCIARALLKNPKILILDDSTSAVDTKTDRLIQTAFAKEIPDTTKLIVAQRISSVEHADKIIVMDSGKINGFGTHEELLANNQIYQEINESQTKGFGQHEENANA